jgi:hypothetical protein
MVGSSSARSASYIMSVLGTPGGRPFELAFRPRRSPPELATGKDRESAPATRGAIRRATLYPV